MKTRLAVDIGAVRATAFYRAATNAVLRRLITSNRWRCCLAVSPDRCDAAAWRAMRLETVPQGGGNLGHRMQRIFDWRIDGPVVIVGSDIPAIRGAHIAAAFRMLAGRDAVLGPACDGGYWLIGLRRRPRVPACFADVRWSSRHALDDTAANMVSAKVGMAALLEDVDDGKALDRVAAWCGRVVLPATLR